jgi:glutamate dehydrogenase/leucine dehydrogenase
VLDIAPEMLRKIRFPRFESVSHHETLHGAGGMLYIASGRLGCEGVRACIAAGSDVTSSKVANQWQELQLSEALGGSGGACAAIGLHLTEAATGEHELWQLTQSCAPVIARTLQQATLLPRDLASAAVSGWMSHAAAQFGFKIRTAAANPVEYCAELDRRRAQAMLHLGTLALQELGKVLENCTVAVVGTGPLACECLQGLRQSEARVIALADESGSLLDSGGIDLSPVLRHAQSGGLLAEYKEGKHALHAAALSAGADLLMLCSSATEIVEANSRSVRPGTVVIDGGASSLAWDATQELGEREILVIPARVVRAAESVDEFLSGSHLDYLQNRDEQLRSYVAEIWERIRKLRKLHGLSAPEAVMLLALGKLAEWERNTRP